MAMSARGTQAVKRANDQLKAVKDYIIGLRSKYKSGNHMTTCFNKFNVYMTAQGHLDAAYRALSEGNVSDSGPTAKRIYKAQRELEDIYSDLGDMCFCESAGGLGRVSTRRRSARKSGRSRR